MLSSSYEIMPGCEGGRVGVAAGKRVEMDITRSGAGKKCSINTHCIGLINLRKEEE